MIYIAATNEGEVTRIHYQPFDEKNGLGKTKEELEKEGFFVDFLPNPEYPEGKDPFLKVDQVTKTLYYEYRDRPLTENEELAFLKKKNEELEAKFKTASEKYDALDKEATPLSELKELRIAKLKEECSAAIYEGFTSGQYKFGFNERDQENFTQRMLTIVAGAVGPFDWKTKNAGVVSLIKEEFVTAINDAEAHKIAKQKKYWALEAQILAAETNAEIDAVTW
ncbi:hypothetical protein [Domibacillus sp.]|uniref:DUF4376 domain-containing protein n=1 Tax=Domibacillus sp. TaxID=1969783 RepID=UPI002810B0F4|nr:hypothetical protein [Domibacillus sp.]